MYSLHHCCKLAGINSNNEVKFYILWDGPYYYQYPQALDFEMYNTPLYCQIFFLDLSQWKPVVKHLRLPIGYGCKDYTHMYI